MGGASPLYGEEKSGTDGFWWGNISEQDHLQDLSIDGRVATFRRNFEGIGYADVDWIDLAQNRDRRHAFVNTAVNIRVQMGNFLANLRTISVSRRTLLVEAVSLDPFLCREWNHDSAVVQPLSYCE